MKTTVLLILMAFSALANLPFDNVKVVEGYATNYELSSKKHSIKLNLDCQSFFHKFDYRENNQVISERYITRSECEVLETKVSICLNEKKQVCFDENNIYEANCHCK